MRTNRFIDLFAGIGGTRIAFEVAGGRCVFSSEIDKFARQTYIANFGEEPFGDINTIVMDDIPQHDVLVGGFPCQPFSLAGVSKLRSLNVKDGFENPDQGNLFFKVAEILASHQPKAFLLENVKNLRGHGKGQTFQIIMRTLRELGYFVNARVIDAAGVVPQHRERIYLVGFLDPVKATDWDWPDMPLRCDRLLDILEPKDQVDPKYYLSDKLWQYLQDYREKHRKKGNGFGFNRPDLEGISRTLSARYHKDGAEILISRPYQKRNPRRLVPRECARLMGFPDSFRIEVSDTQAYRQFGNSVVVPVVEQLAKQILQSLGTGTIVKADSRDWIPISQSRLI